MAERIDNHRFEFYGEGLPDVDDFATSKPAEDEDKKDEE